jgi:hypothetical protein
MKPLTLSPNWLDENIQSAKRQMNRLNLAMRDTNMNQGTIGHLDNGKTGLASAVAAMLAAEEKKVDPNLTVPVDDNPERPEVDPDPVKPKKDKKGKK